VISATGTVIGAFAAGRSLGHSRHYMRLPMAGLAIGMASLAVMAATPAGLSLAGISCLLFLCGAGIGPMYPVTTVLIQNAVLPHQFGGDENPGEHRGEIGRHRALRQPVQGDEAAGGIDLGEHDGAESGDDDGAAEQAEKIERSRDDAGTCLAAALLCLAGIEERPLRGPAPAGSREGRADRCRVAPWRATRPRPGRRGR